MCISSKWWSADFNPWCMNLDHYIYYIYTKEDLNFHPTFHNLTYEIKVYNWLIEILDLTVL